MSKQAKSCGAIDGRTYQGQMPPLDRLDIEKWQGRHERFASDTARFLQFDISPNGHCIITQQQKVIYQGGNIDEAIAAYNAAVKP